MDLLEWDSNSIIQQLKWLLELRNKIRLNLIETY